MYFKKKSEYFRLSVASVYTDVNQSIYCFKATGLFGWIGYKILRSNVMCSTKISHKGDNWLIGFYTWLKKSIQQASFGHILHTCMMFGSKVMTF